MVRREEQPWESRATVLLDLRSAGHRGEGPAASFEWAVSAIASVAGHLRDAGYRVRLVASPQVDIDANDAAGDTLLLDHLAEVKASPRHDIATLVEQVRRRADGGLVIAALGQINAAEAEMLSTIRGNGATCIALLIDSSTWLNLPAEARAAAEREHATSALALLHSGWRVIPVTHGAKLPMLWPQAGRGSAGFAWRAALAETAMTGGPR